MGYKQLIRNFFILSWKFGLTKKRNWIFTLAEILVPTLLFIGITVIKNEIGPGTLNNDSSNPKAIPFLYEYCFVSRNDSVENIDERLIYYTSKGHNGKPLDLVEGLIVHLRGYYATFDIACAEALESILVPIILPISMASIFSVLIGLKLSIDELPLHLVNKTSVLDTLEPIENNISSIIFYTPKNTLTTKLIAIASSFLDSGSIKARFEHIKSEAELLRKAKLHKAGIQFPNVQFIGGIVFEENFIYNDAGDGSDSIPPLNYTLRLTTRYSSPQTKLLYPIFPVSGVGKAGLIYTKFTYLQLLINLSYAAVVSGTRTSVLTDFFEEIMAYPPHVSSPFGTILALILPMFTVLSFSFGIPTILKGLVQEKQTGAKELMKLMGMPNWLLWISWFFNAIIMFTITIAIVLILLCIEWSEGTGKVFQHSSPAVIFLFFFIYCFTLTSIVFAISTFFDSPNLALSVALIFQTMSFVVPFAAIPIENLAHMPFYQKLILALIPNYALTWGIDKITRHENHGIGAQFSNLFDSYEPGDPSSLGLILVMFLATAFIAFLILFYVENVNPGSYGVGKPYNFLFTKSYWISKEKKIDELDNELEEYDEKKFEPHPKNLIAGIVVKGIEKQFKNLNGTKTMAVNGVTFSAYESQITALLGHNGAGKTTTMSILTGILSPSGTKGTAYISGKSIRTEMSSVRKSLGLCPQHNMLFDDMSVFEHFVLFGMIKGLSMTEAKNEAQTYLPKLELEAKSTTAVSKLSGGMKRKVHLGIAIIGGSKVILLDEPTSGMDPEARRGMWDVLNELKKERTILLSTHFMEEADILGDRIAIMNHGKVVCYGSPHFLKTKLGNGYTLTIDTIPGNCDSTKLTEIIKSNNLTISKIKSNSSKFECDIPYAYSSKFPSMIKKIESVKKDQGIIGYSFAVSTLEEVFLNVGGDDHEKDQDFNHIVNYKNKKPKLGGLQLELSRLKGLLVKRNIYAIRRYALHLFLLIFPILNTMIAIWSQNKGDPFKLDFVPVSFDFRAYENPVVIYENTIPGIDNIIQDVVSKLGGANLHKVNSINEMALKQANKSLANYEIHYILGAKFSKNDLTNRITFTSIYNSFPNHVKPLGVNLISNVYIQTLNKSGDHFITTYSYPLPEDKSFGKVIRTDLARETFNYGLAIPTSFGILVAGAIIYQISERITSAKQVQLMTGVSEAMFWGTSFIWDFLFALIPIVISVVILAVFDSGNTFESTESYMTLFLVSILFIASSFPLAYLLSFKLSTVASGFAFLLTMTILCGNIAPMGTMILRTFGKQFDSSNLILGSNILRGIFSPFPVLHYSLSVMAICELESKNRMCIDGMDESTLISLCESLSPEVLSNSQLAQSFAPCCSVKYVPEEIAVCGQISDLEGNTYDCLEQESLFNWDLKNGLNINILITCIIGLFYAIFLLLLESKKFKFISIYMTNRNEQSESKDDELDEDVRSEGDRVLYGGQNDNALTVINLKKTYGNFTAVKGITFGVLEGECFGLLGINGAGKTTTFRMLTGNETPSSGEARMKQISLNHNRKNFLKSIGYCPQFDSVIEQLSGRELLVLFARLRGIHNEEIEIEVTRWLRFLGILEYADKRCGTYSGGNKRKLNVALSLVGDPKIIFMDEPSSGVDPVARRTLWNVIKAIKDGGRCIVLTSHSMEECEFLCDRLAIMVNGQFQCFGKPMHLKQKFGEGFTLVIRLNLVDISNEESKLITQTISKQILNSFKSCKITDEHAGYVHFHIGDKNTTWLNLFEKLEKLSYEFSELEDYSIAETTLEEVFLSFAKKQKDLVKKKK